MRLILALSCLVAIHSANAKTKFEFDEIKVKTPLDKNEVAAVCGKVEGSGKESAEAFFYKTTDQLWLRARQNVKTKKEAIEYCKSREPKGAWKLPSPKEIHTNSRNVVTGSYWVDGDNVFDPRSKMNVYHKNFQESVGDEDCGDTTCTALCIGAAEIEIDKDLKSLEFDRQTMETRSQKIEQDKITVEIEIKIPAEGKQKQSVVWVGPLKDRKPLSSYEWTSGDTSNWRLVGFTKSGDSFWFYREDIEGAVALYSYDTAGLTQHIWKKPAFFTKVHRTLDGGLHFFDLCGRRTGILFSEPAKFEGKSYQTGDSLILKN